jgi:hypothetical protein
MRTLFTIVGALFILAGVVWFLQGIGMLPGSYMTGQIRWAWYGAAAVCAGLLAIGFGRRRR